MPDIINNVTTSTGLLHEVMQETIKQSFAAAGFPVYEYDPATQRFRDVVSGEELEYEVRFPYLRWLSSMSASEDQHRTFPAMSLIVDLSDPELLPIGGNTTMGPSSSNRAQIYLSRMNPTTGEFLSSTSIEAILSRGGGSVYQQNKHVVFMNPEPGYLIVLVLGYSGFSGGTPRIFSFLLNYNLSAPSVSVRSGHHIDLGFSSSVRDVDSLLCSKVYKYEDETRVYYSSLIVFREAQTNQENLSLLTISYDKTNKRIASITQKRIATDLANYFPWANILPQDQVYRRDWSLVYVFYGLLTDPTSLSSPAWGVKESLYVMDSPTGATGNAFFVLKNVSKYYSKIILFKVPFSFDLNTSSPQDSQLDLDLSNIKVYGPIDVFQSFNNAYASNDMETIEFPKRSTYSPPNNYRFKIEEYKEIRYTDATLVVNNDIDQDRLSISVFLYSLENDLSNENYDFFANPHTKINNFEITPGGGVYFTGHTVLSHAVPSYAFLVSKYHEDVIALATLASNNPRLTSESSIYNHWIISFKRRVNTEDFSSSPSSRLLQPYLAKVSLNGLRAYVPDSTPYPDKTVYRSKNFVFVTNVMWTNHYDNGFFVPLFYVIKPGGDGIWFKRDTIYIGIFSYNTSTHHPKLSFMVNGTPVEILHNTSSTRPDYGAQVNSTLSLVYRLMVAQDRSGIAQIGIQGTNYLQFARMFAFDVDGDDGTLFGLYAPFANLVLQVGGRGAVIPFANIPASLGGGSGFEYKTRAHQRNAYLSRPGFARPVMYPLKDINNRSVRFSWDIVINNTSLTVDAPTSIVVFWERDPDFGSLGVSIPTPILGLPSPADFITAVDKSNTVAIGDYIYLTDPQGNQMRYAVFHQESLSYYVNTNTSETTNYRTLYAIRVS